MSRPERVLLFDPYLATLGGGERYMFALARLCQRYGHDVTLAAPELPSTQALTRQGYDPTVRLATMSGSGFARASRRHDRVICLTNGIPPVSLCRNSYLMVQFPFTVLSRQLPKRWLQRAALRGYTCLTNSEFTHRHLRERWGLDSSVVHPPVEGGSYEESAKQHSLLAVGRFFAGGHSKRQDVLIEAFKALPADLQASWRLTLAGGRATDPASRAYIERLSAAAAGHNIGFLFDATSEALAAAYSQATLFWHATGFGRPADNPERAEHFGMSTVEAMSYGCVPLVFDDGGQREIVTAGSGFLWRAVEELVATTAQLMRDPQAVRRTAASAHAVSSAYSVDAFELRAAAVLSL